MSKNLLFFTLIIINVISGIEVDIFTPSFLEIQKSFNVSTGSLELTLSLNFIAYCLSALFTGDLCDKYGSKIILNISIVIFIIGSLLCTVTNNFNLLLLGRIIQGIGIAGPAVASYTLIAKCYSSEKQSHIVAMINGITTMSMAVAPVLGSWLTIHMSWRSNFGFLFIAGLVCFVFVFTTLRQFNEKILVSETKTGYMQILKTPILVQMILAFALLVAPYWIFVGMSPVIYMSYMKVPLHQFGYYQGATCLVFGIISLMSSSLIMKIGEKKCLVISFFISTIASIMLLIIGFSSIKNPVLLSLGICILGAGSVFPVNILMLMLLRSVGYLKSRVTALITLTRLCIAASMITILGYTYTNNFKLTSLVMFLNLVCGIFIVTKLLRSNAFSDDGKQLSLLKILPHNDSLESKENV